MQMSSPPIWLELSQRSHFSKPSSQWIAKWSVSCKMCNPPPPPLRAHKTRSFTFLQIREPQESPFCYGERAAPPPHRAAAPAPPPPPPREAPRRPRPLPGGSAGPGAAGGSEPQRGEPDPFPFAPRFPRRRRDGWERGANGATPSRVCPSQRSARSPRPGSGEEPRGVPEVPAAPPPPAPGAPPGAANGGCGGYGSRLHEHRRREELPAPPGSRTPL